MAKKNEVSLIRKDTGTLHSQLHDTLLAKIRSGEYKPGEKLPTEAQLIETYGVSRMTVRRALDDLRRDGLVERKPALGTFVTEPSLNAQISGLHSLTDEITALGLKPSSILLDLQYPAASKEVSQQLQISEGSEVLRLDRVRSADGRPFYVAQSFLNVQLFPELKTIDYASPQLSLLDSYRTVLGSEAERMTQLLSAASAPPLAQKAFGIKSDAPVLVFERVVYLAGNRPVEYVKAYFRGESYKFYSELSQQSHP